MRQFGTPIRGARVRPGAYGVVYDSVRGLAVVRDRGGPLHLPGGGIEPGEDDLVAVVREVAEETGLAVEVIERIGIVRQAIDHLNKLSHYVSCRILAEGDALEPDHELGWMDWREASSTLRLDADRWAIRQWARSRGHLDV